MEDVPVGDDLPSSRSSDTEGPLVKTPSKSSAAGSIKTVSCRVCQYKINIEGKLNQHLVECTKCHEATPIKKAPPGITYAYCSCNSLVVGTSELEKVICPRPECENTVNMTPSPVNHSKGNLPEVRRIYCSNCTDTFEVKTRNKVFERCPQCRKVSYLLENSFRWRSVICFASLFTVAVLIFLILAIRYGSSLHPKYYLAYIGLAIALGVLIFACHFLCCQMNKSLESSKRSQRLLSFVTSV